MARVYDPQKAHEYYEANKKLKGRKKAATKPGASVKKPVSKAVTKSVKAQKAKARIVRLRSKIKRLNSALSEVEALLSEKRQTARKNDKENSDGKTSAKERQSSKEYREKNQQKIAEKRNNAKSSGDSSSSSKSVSDMNVEELTERSNKIGATLKDAQRQLSNANQELGQLAHSAIVTDGNVNELFTQFHLAERIPSR